MTAPQLALEWREGADIPSHGIGPAVMAWCGCGWRAGCPSRLYKQEATAAVEAAYEAHRRAEHPYADELPAVGLRGQEKTE